MYAGLREVTQFKAYSKILTVNERKFVGAWHGGLRVTFRAW